MAMKNGSILLFQDQQGRQTHLPASWPVQSCSLRRTNGRTSDFGHARPSRIRSSAPSSRSAPSPDPDQTRSSTAVATAFGHATTTSTRSTAQGSRASLLLYRKLFTTSHSSVRSSSSAMMPANMATRNAPENGLRISTSNLTRLLGGGMLRITRAARKQD